MKLEKAYSIIEALKANLSSFGYVNAYASSLGGPERCSVILALSKDKREHWKNGILENSNYAKFHISSENKRENIIRNSEGIVGYTLTPRVKVVYVSGNRNGFRTKSYNPNCDDFLEKLCLHMRKWMES